MPSKPEQMKIHGYGEFRGQVYCGVIWLQSLKVSVDASEWTCANCVAKRKRVLAHEAQQAKEVMAQHR